MPEQQPSLAWLFFSFQGRIARRSFIFSILFLLLPQFVIVFQLIKNEGNPAAIAGLMLVMMALLVATLWSVFAISTKRLHDLGAPGALSLLAFFPGINWLFFLALAILPSSPEANDYGPPPFGD